MRKLTEEEVRMQGGVCHICYKAVDEIYLLRDWEKEKIYRAIHKKERHVRQEWRLVRAKDGGWIENYSCQLYGEGLGIEEDLWIRDWLEELRKG